MITSKSFFTPTDKKSPKNQPPLFLLPPSYLFTPLLLYFRYYEVLHVGNQMNSPCTTSAFSITQLQRGLKCSRILFHSFSHSSRFLCSKVGEDVDVVLRAEHLIRCVILPAALGFPIPQPRLPPFISWQEPEHRLSCRPGFLYVFLQHLLFRHNVL